MEMKKVRDGFKTPSHGICPLKGYPPLPQASTEEIGPKNLETDMRNIFTEDTST